MRVATVTNFELKGVIEIYFITRFIIKLVVLCIEHLKLISFFSKLDC